MAQILRTRRSATTWLATVVSSWLAVSLGACGGEDRVELRLQPCDIDGFPRSVRVRIEAFDADGAVLGEPKAESFAIPEASVFDDGYATVGYVPPAGATSATVTIGWFADTSAGSLSASEHIVLWPNIKLPALGGSIDLSAEGCAPIGGTSGTGGTDTEGTTTEGTTTEGTTTEGTTTTGTTTEGTTTTGTTTTGTTTEGTTTEGTTTEGTTTEGTTTTGTTGGDTMGGMACDAEEPLCETPGPGEVGTLLSCIGGVWTEDVANACDAICGDDFYGFEQGKALGCSGNGSGSAWACLCVEGSGSFPCEPMDEKCTFQGRSSQVIQLCVDGELAKGSCPEKCSDDPSPICTL